MFFFLLPNSSLDEDPSALSFNMGKGMSGTVQLKDLQGVIVRPP